MSCSNQKNEQTQVILQSPGLEKIIIQENYSTPQLSDHISKYNNIMAEPNMAGKKQALAVESGSQVKPKVGFKRQPSIKILPQYIQQTLFIDVHYGKEKTTLSLLFVNQYSCIHNHGNMREGNYGSVYETKILGQDVAVKCLRYSNKQKSSQNFEQTLIKVLIEIVIMLKASSLKAGPYYPEQLAGFHLIIYKECMQFMMESCKLPGQVLEQSLKNDLKQNLRVLHQNKIIHFDIKRENFSFSKKYDRYVFLDFGLSQFIEEQLGFLTYTKFRGTFGKCIDEMQKLFISQKQDWIDVYYNDAHCLKKMLQQLKVNKTYEYGSQRQDYSEVTFVRQYLQHYLIILKRIFLSQQLKQQDISRKVKVHEVLLKRLRADYSKIIQLIMSSMNFDLYEATSLCSLLKLIESPDYDFNSTKYRLRKHIKVYKKYIQNYEESQEHDQSFLFYRSCYVKINQTIAQITKSEKEQKLKHMKVLQQVPSKISSGKLFQEPYLSIFTEACNVTSQYTSYAQKLNKLQVFLKVLKIPSKKQEKDQNQCFLKVFYYCFSNLPMTYEVFNSVIISVAVLDLISQKQFTELIHSIQSKQLSSIQKLKAILSILSALYWVYTKIATKLNYYELMNSTLCQLRLILSKMTTSSHFELTLKQQFEFLSEIIVQTQYFRKKEEITRMKKDFKLKIEPTLTTWAATNIFFKRLLYFMRLTLLLKRFETTFQQQEYSKNNDQSILRCSNMLITKRNLLGQCKNENIQSSEQFFIYLLYEDVHKFHLFQNSQNFLRGQQASELPTFVKRSILSLENYQQTVKKLVQILPNANLIDKIEIISVSLCKFSSLLINSHLLDLSQLVSIIQTIIEQIPDLVLSQNLYIKHFTPIYLKSCFKLLEIQASFQVFTHSQLRKRRRRLISIFQEGTKRQRCLKCKVQKLFYLSIQNLKLLAESENELFVNALISVLRFCLDNSYLFELITSLFNTISQMQESHMISFMEVVSQMLSLANFQNYDMDIRYIALETIMKCYKHLVFFHKYEQASLLCLKLFDYMKYHDYPKDIIGMIYSIQQSFQGVLKSCQGLPQDQLRCFITKKFAIRTKTPHSSRHEMVLKHLQVCNLLLPSKNKFIALLLTAILRLVHNYQDERIKVKRFLAKIAYSVNQLDVYSKEFVLSSYYLFHFLVAGQDRSQRNTNFILSKAFKSRNSYSNFRCVLRFRKNGEVQQMMKRTELARKVEKLNSHCRNKCKK